MSQYHTGEPKSNVILQRNCLMKILHPVSRLNAISIIERLRTYRIYINHMKYDELKEANTKQCEMLSYNKYQKAVDDNISIKMGCELFYKDKLIAYMSRIQGDHVKIYSQACLAVRDPRKVCSPCKKISRLFQKLTREPKPSIIIPPVAPESQTPASSTTVIEAREAVPLCKWLGCELEGQMFDSVLELNSHMQEHIPKLLNLPESQRTFICQWGTCKSTKQTRKDLVRHIKSAHSGEDNEQAMLSITAEIDANSKKPKQARKWSDELCDRLNSCVGTGRKIITYVIIINPKRHWK